MSLSNDIAAEFGQQKLMSFFSSALVIFGFAINLCNGSFLIKIKHRNKMLVTILFLVMSVGLFVLARCVRVFALTIVATLLMGAGINLGDVTVLGFMKCFPPFAISGYSSGTGLGGILGGSLYLILKLMNFSITATLVSMLAFFPVYGMSFYFVVRLQLKIQSDSALINSKLEDEENVDDFESTSSVLLPNQNSQEVLQEKEAKINKKLTWSTFKQVNSKAGGLFAAFALMYFFAYLCITSFASILQSKYESQFETSKTPKAITMLFEILLLTYYVGRCCTRSSLGLVQIKRVWLIILWLTVFSGIFMIQIFTKKPPFILIPICNVFFVGAIGGLSYVNIYDQIMRHPRVSKREQELALSINAMLMNVGIISSSFVGYLFLLVFSK